MQPSAEVRDQRGLRLLALGAPSFSSAYAIADVQIILDGGGIRGLSELIILEEIMNRIKHLDKLNHVPRPCDYFDLIGGVSTGGLIALMLGRLQMPIGDAIQTYVQFTHQVFVSHKWFGGKEGMFKATQFEKSFQAIVKSALGDPGALMRDRGESGCKSFVSSLPAANMSLPVLFRTYEVSANQSDNCTIWEAARATSVVPQLFKPISIGVEGLKQQFLGASMGWNNPALQVLEEAESCFGSDCQVACLVSLGAGHPQTIAWQTSQWLSDSLVHMLKDISTNCENIAEQLEKRFKNISGVYFRLSVEQGMQPAALDDWQRLGEIKTHTSQYLAQVKISQIVDAVTQALSLCQPRITIGIINAPSVSVAKIEVSLEHISSPTPFFVGREDILAALDQCFSSSETSVGLKLQRRYVLYGLGGAGKTQIALKFVQQFSDRFSETHFIDASTVTSLDMFFRNLGEKRIGKDATAKDGLLWLAQKKEEWLLVLDNADDPDINLVEYFPKASHGNIIITTRNQTCCIHAPYNNTEIADISDDNAIKLLFDISNRPYDLTLGLAIVKELGNLALAIVQAGAYLLQDPGLELSDYLESYRRNRAKYLSRNTKQTVSDYTKPVYATWDMSFARLSVPAKQLLRICAFLHYSGITVSFFTDAFEWNKTHPTSSDTGFLKEVKVFFKYYIDNNGDWDEILFRETLVELGSYSLIHASQHNAYSIHSLVHAWAAEHETSDIQTNAFVCTSELLYCVCQLRFEQKNVKSMQMLVSHLQNVQSQTQSLNMDIALVFASIYRECIMLKEAENLQKQVIEYKQTTLGNDHPDTLLAMENLAITYHKQGQFTKAEQLRSYVVEAYMKIFGKDHLSTLSAIGHLAMTYWSQGQWSKAEELQSNVVIAQSSILGMEHPDTLSTLGNLASIYVNQGRWTEAEQLQLHILQIFNKIHGKDHSETLTIMSNLALTYKKQGRWTEAEQLESQVLEVRKRIFGEDHPDTLTIMNNLAATYQRQGQWPKAEQLQLQALQGMKKVLGEEHPETLTVMNNLALTYQKQGQWSQAEKLETYVLEVCRNIFGEDYPATLTACGNLGLTYQKLGNLTKAEELVTLVVKARKRILGENHPSTLLTMAGLASIYLDQGYWTEAEQLGSYVIEELTKLLGKDHPDILGVISNLASTYVKLDRWTEAGDLLLQVMEARKRILGEDHPDTLMVMGNLAVAYSNQGQWAKAAELESHVLEVRKKIYGENHPDVLVAMRNLAMTLRNLGQLTKAEQLELQAQKVEKAIPAEYLNNM
ncbi:Kinesin light chain [Hypsizygus marmoreus]|uniref:Kinesin light chain n=1 Tax=Hypsizygus marmoreus TaxID=39966 RepID=A0A369J6N9_HYPMA|nr:Kinesin light chain [Hypsizygus marmoreus]